MYELNRLIMGFLSRILKVIFENSTDFLAVRGPPKLWKLTVHSKLNVIYNFYSPLLWTLGIITCNSPNYTSTYAGFGYVLTLSEDYIVGKKPHTHLLVLSCVWASEVQRTSYFSKPDSKFSLNVPLWLNILLLHCLYVL